MNTDLRPGRSPSGEMRTTRTTVPSSFTLRLIFWLLVVFAGSVGGAATLDKTNNSDALNLGSSWVGGVPPGAADIAQWGATVTSNNTVDLGSNQNWWAIKIANPGGSITLTGAQILTLSATNIGMDLSTATQNLTNYCDLTIAADHSWKITNNRVLAIAGDVSATGRTVTKESPGKLSLDAGVSTYKHLWNTGGGTVEINGGTHTITDWFRAASYGGGAAVMNGGALNVNGILMVAYGQGSTGGVLVINGGTVSTPEVRMCQANDSALHLNGGTLTAGFIQDAGGAGDVSEVNFNGGTLRARQNRSDFMQGLDHAYVKTNGAVLDLQGYNLTILQPLEHHAALGATPDGGLRKSGAGMLTLNGTNTYTGPTLVSSGTLAVNGRLSGTGAVTVAASAILTGSGIITGAITLQGNATLSVPASDLAVGSLFLATNSLLELALGGPDNLSNAVLKVFGNLTLAGQLRVVNASNIIPGTSYAAIAYTGTLTNLGMIPDPFSQYEIAVNTNTPGWVRLDIVRQYPFVEITNGDLAVSTTSTQLTALLHGIPTRPLWYEVRDQAGRLWDYGTHAFTSPWPFMVRHLREGTNTITVFAATPGGTIASNSVRAVMTLAVDPPVRPRPWPAEIWWGGSCHDNLYNTNGNIIGTYSRMAQLTNTAGWDFVKRWQDGFFLHGYVWANGIARMTNWVSVGNSISAQLAPYYGRYWLENAWRPQTNISYGTSSVSGQAGSVTNMLNVGFALTEMDQDFNPMAQDMGIWHPGWAMQDHVTATVGDMTMASTNYPYSSGMWKDFLTGFTLRTPEVKQGWVYSPVWFHWQTWPSLATDNNILNPLKDDSNNIIYFNSNTVAINLDMYDYLRAAMRVQSNVVPPFAFASDCPWEYYGKYPGNPGGWSQAWQATNRAKIRLYENWLQTNGCRHSMICNSSEAGSSANPDAYDTTYKNNSLSTLFMHQAEGGRASRYVFESWYQGPFTILPETKSGSYANLAMEAIKYLKGVRDTNGTLEGMSFSILNTGAVVTVQLRNDGDVKCLPVIQAFESGAGGTLIKYYDNAGREITTAIKSPEGFIVTNFLAPGQTTTISVAVQGNPVAFSKTVTLEAFWNPQDPTGFVRDRLAMLLPPPQEPFGGTPVQLPGIIQTENYDLGGESVGYHDTTLTNLSALYRPWEGVDLDACTDTGGGYNLGSVVAGEWVEYTVQAVYSGPYILEVRYASSGTGGTYHVEMDGTNATGFLTVSNTGGWQTWQTLVRTNINLVAGQHVLRLVMDTNGPSGYIGNFNWLRFTYLDTNNPATNYVWTNAAGGLWSVAGNWSNNYAPPVGGNSNGALRFAVNASMTANNNLAGNFALNSLEFTNPSNMPGTLAGGLLRFTPLTTTLAPPQLSQNGGGTYTLSNAIELTDLLNLNSTTNGQVILAGNVSGAGGLIKNGGNLVILSGSNSYSGPTRILAGTLQFGTSATNSLPPGDVTNNATLKVVVATNTTTTYPGDISGTGTFYKDGFGTLVLCGSNSFTGPVTISSGALWVRDSQGLGLGTKTITMNNGTAGHPELHLDGSAGNINLPPTLSYTMSWAEGTLFNEAGDNTVQGNITLTAGGGDSHFISRAGSLTLSGSIAPNTANRALRLSGPGVGNITGVIADGGANTLMVRVLSGVWTLSNTNPFSRGTAIEGGLLLVNGSLSATSAVNVNASGSLGGTGTINGPVTVQNFGTLLTLPQTNIGTLKLATNLMFAAQATNYMKIGRDLATNDLISVAATVTYNGNLVVTNLGGLFRAGDRFKLYNASNYVGAFTNFTLPPMRPGLIWSNKLALDGSLEVIGTPANLQMSSPASAGATLIWSGTGGQSGNAYYLLASTNILTPVTHWTVIATNYFDANGDFRATNSLIVTNRQGFHRVLIP